MQLEKRDWIHDRDSMGSFDYSVDQLHLLRVLILVRPDPFKDVSDGGIILHSERLEEQHSGQVLKTGSKVKGISTGDDILFNKHEGVVITLDGERLLMMKEEDVKAVKRDGAVSPLKDKVIIKRLEATAGYKGCLVLPDTAKEIQDKGVVISLGPDVVSDVNTGDTVFFKPNAGTKVEIENEVHIIVEEYNIYGVEE